MIEGGGAWRSSSASHAGTTRPTRSRRSAPPKARLITGDRGAGYYLSAVEKGGEPAGTWIGNGAAELGFHDGDVVRREDFEPLYGQFLDPRDPSGRPTWAARRG